MKRLLCVLALLAAAAGAAASGIHGAVVGSACAVAIGISNVTVSHIVVSPNDALTSYSLESGGNTVRSPGAALPAWMAPTASCGQTTSSYEVRATLSAGDAVDSGTVGSWLNLGTTRTWTQGVTINAADTDSSTLTVEIRRASDSVVVTTATVTLTAQVDI